MPQLKTKWQENGKTVKANEISRKISSIPTSKNYRALHRHRVSEMAMRPQYVAVSSPAEAISQGSLPSGLGFGWNVL